MDSINNNTEFLQKLPKLELHAHLSGSVRDSTIKELCQQYRIPIPEALKHISTSSSSSSSRTNNRRSLSECFSIFKSIHSVLHTKDILKRVVWEALEDFISCNVCYLELRSTPRIMVGNKDNVVTLDKYGYIMTVLETMQEFELQNGQHPNINITLPKISCRYIVSIDRSKGIDEAWENVKLACKIKNSTEIGKQRIVGVDVSGDPNKGSFEDFVPVLEYARTVGKLFVTIHIGEIPCSDTDNTIFNFNNNNDTDKNKVEQLERADNETISIIEFKPDRLGHALFLPQTVWKSLQKSPIPIECCPTSNILTIELASHTHEESIIKALQHNKHPILKYLLTNNNQNYHHHYPMSISTDDPGVFHTNPCRELRLIMFAFPDIVTKKFIVERLVLACIDQIFDLEVKEELEKLIRIELETCDSDNLN